MLFINSKFAAQTLFVGTHFETYVPDFRGATMHEATEWHGATWPKPPRDGGTAQSQVYAYERLKQEMERLKKHEDEQRFFRKELRARRNMSRPGSGDWIMNLFYQASSNYGQSVTLPLLWLLGLFALGGSVFYVMHTTAPTAIAVNLIAVNLQAIPHAAALSFANIVPFVPISHEIINAAAVASMSKVEKIVAVAQSLLGTPLLFLLGLALRNRFGMK
jgi:hypothetical protein